MISYGECRQVGLHKNPASNIYIAIQLRAACPKVHDIHAAMQIHQFYQNHKQEVLFIDMRWRNSLSSERGVAWLVGVFSADRNTVDL